MKTNYTYFLKTILALVVIESALMAQQQLPNSITPKLQYSNNQILHNSDILKLHHSIHPFFRQSSTPSFQTTDDTSIVQSEISPFRFGLVVGASAGIITLAHLQNYNSWWKGERAPFHLDNDENANLYADKFGHFYFSYVASDIMSRSFHWSGMEEQDAAMLGGGLALAFQLYVEVEDAFHPNLGFSLGDGVADALGAALPALRLEYPSLNTLSLKWSAIPSPRFQRGDFRTIIDDYESQYYWLSVNIKDALGKSSPGFIPSFLNLALGYGVKNLSINENKESELYLSLDIDFTKLPGDGAFLHSIKHILNYFHAPMPTIRIAPSVIGYGLRL
ncbi:MAG: DUF2279 domain-containing protein [Ignavibacteriales bacterium]|nr:DUF2279 domain-containing protein [Ignavibacteriales bacterium]